jgi:hypothetical protein
MMKSMNEKICIAHGLAVVLGELLNEDSLVVPDEIADMIWGHADGLTAKHLYNMMDGRCSLAAFIAFDPVKAEAHLDDDILVMEGLA